MTEEEQEQAALLFSQARKNSLHLTGAVTETTIGVIAKQFDAIIIGSDQVWADIHEKQAVYLGEWRPAFSGRLLAYAACSPLKKIQRPYLKRNRKLLAGFAGISVRDQHTADIFENAYNIRYPVVADPTLLFRKWDEVAEPVRRNEKYILFYIIRQELEGTLANAAARLKKLYPGCRILTVLTTETKLDRNAAYIDEFVIPNPFQWVSLIRHAACVLTDSYHCALFSLQFSVPFFSYYREKDYGKYRFLELRNRFHLSDPFITSSEMIQKAGSRFADTSYLADFIDLSSYTKKDTTLENGNKLLGVFDVKFDDEMLDDKGYQTLDKIEWLDKNYNFSDNKSEKNSSIIAEATDFTNQYNIFLNRNNRLDDKLNSAQRKIESISKSINENITKNAINNSKSKTEPNEIDTSEQKLLEEEEKKNKE